MCGRFSFFGLSDRAYVAEKTYSGVDCSGKRRAEIAGKDSLGFLISDEHFSEFFKIKQSGIIRRFPCFDKNNWLWYGH